MDDRELLQAYVEDRCEKAFAAMVDRYINLVYSAALRMVRDATLAEDVTQAVFLALARKAGSIREGSSLPGWLYQVTHHQAANAVRADRIRRRHEMEAVTMNNPRDEQSIAWESLAPHLDEAMASLSRRDQDAVVQRFFQGRSWREIAQAMALSEDAAQKRVSRALERLRACLARRGVTMTASVLAVAMTTNAVKAAPIALAPAVVKTSLAGTTGSGSWRLLGGHAMTKLTLAALVLIAMGLAAAQLVAQKETAAPAPAQAGQPAAADAEAPTDLLEGLVLHMTFDVAEPEAKVTDASPLKNDGIVKGAHWTADGHRGGAYEFKNDEERIEIRNHQSLNPPSLTVSAWIRTTAADGEWRRIIDKAWDKSYALSIAGKWQKNDWSGQPCIELGLGEHFSVTQTRVTDGKWHHVVATFDGIQQCLYVDGKPDGKPLVWKEPGDVGSTDYGVTIGCNMTNPPGSRDYHQSFRGTIDEPMIWNRALSADEVAQLYASQK